MSYLKAGGSLRNVKSADVVLVNPTHVAIALRYRMAVMAAPMVVAKGGERLAARIRQAAFIYSVPVVECRGLARELFFQAQIGAEIPSHFYADIAGVYRDRGLLREGA
jgi:flagellar biosynthesis protein FlhB